MPKHKILFLAANPIGTDRLALDHEAHAIHVELERSGCRDQFEFITRWAVEPLDLLRELRKLRPTIVHFSGHGQSASATRRQDVFVSRDISDSSEPSGLEREAGLIFQTANGMPMFAPATGIKQALQKAGRSVRVVVLNACYSAELARVLASQVDCVVGMRSSVRDEAARSFAIGFYGGLGERESVASAFGHGQAAMAMTTTGQEDLPQLHVCPGVDADRFILPNPDRKNGWLSSAQEVAPAIRIVLGIAALATAAALARALTGGILARTGLTVIVILTLALLLLFLAQVADKKRAQGAVAGSTKIAIWFLLGLCMLYSSLSTTSFWLGFPLDWRPIPEPTSGSTFPRTDPALTRPQNGQPSDAPIRGPVSPPSEPPDQPIHPTPAVPQGSGSGGIQGNCQNKLIDSNGNIVIGGNCNISLQNDIKRQKGEKMKDVKTLMAPIVVAAAVVTPVGDQQDAFAQTVAGNCNINVHGNGNLVVGSTCIIKIGDLKQEGSRKLLIDRTLEFTAPHNAIDLPGWTIVFKPGGKLRVHGGELVITARTMTAVDGGKIDIDGTGIEGAPGSADVALDGNGGFPDRRPVAEKHDPDGRPVWDTVNKSDYINANVDCDNHRGGQSWGLDGHSGQKGGTGANISITVDTPVTATWQWTVAGGTGGAGGPGGKGARHKLRGTQDHHECPSGGNGALGTTGDAGACMIKVGKGTARACPAQ